MATPDDVMSADSRYNGRFATPSVVGCYFGRGEEDEDERISEVAGGGRGGASGSGGARDGSKVDRSSGAAEVVGMLLIDRMRSDAAVGRVMRLSKLGKGAVDNSEATPLEGRRGRQEPLGIREAGYNKHCDVRGGVSFGDHTWH